MDRRFSLDDVRQDVYVYDPDSGVGKDLRVADVTLMVVRQDDIFDRHFEPGLQLSFSQSMLSQKPSTTMIPAGVTTNIPFWGPPKRCTCGVN